MIFYKKANIALLSITSFFTPHLLSAHNPLDIYSLSSNEIKLSSNIEHDFSIININQNSATYVDFTIVYNQQVLDIVLHTKELKLCPDTISKVSIKNNITVMDTISFSDELIDEYQLKICVEKIAEYSDNKISQL